MRFITIKVTKEHLKTPLRKYEKIPHYNAIWPNLNAVATAISEHPEWAQYGKDTIQYINCSDHYFFLKNGKTHFQQFNLDLYTRCWMEDYKRRGGRMPELIITINLTTNEVHTATTRQQVEHPAWHCHFKIDDPDQDKIRHRVVKFISPTEAGAKKRADKFLIGDFLPQRLRNNHTMVRLERSKSLYRIRLLPLQATMD